MSKAPTPKKQVKRGVGHTHAPRGKRVKVVLHTGETFTDRFKENEAGYIYFYDHPKIKANKVYKLSILRANQL